MKKLRRSRSALSTLESALLIVVIIVAGVAGYFGYLAMLPPPPPPPGPASITGKVINAETGAAIPGAAIEANGYLTSTGPDGTYSLSVKVGTYTVTASTEGYETETASLDASEEKSYTVDVPLPPIPRPPPDWVKTNTLIAESASTYQWFDPHVSYYQFDYWILWQTVEMLLWYNGSSSTDIIPWLAESYEMITPTQYEFKLRKDITFQDGTPFNATAVWFSLNRLLIIDGTSGTGTPGSQAAWMVQQLLNTSLSTALSGKQQPWDAEWVQKVLDQNFVEIVDDYTVRLNLKTPTTQFIPILAGPWCAIISPTSTIKMDYEHGGWDYAAEQTPNINYTKYFENMAGNGITGLNLPETGWSIGSGPYILDSVDPTTYRIVMKGNPDYWGGPPNLEYPYPKGSPKISTIEILFQPSFATRLLNLMAGKVTGIGVPSAEMFSVVERDGWLERGELISRVTDVTVQGPYSLFATYWFDFDTNITTPEGKLRDWQPFADWRIRMAVGCAINMTYANIYINNRMGIVAQNIIPPGTAPEGAFNPEVKPAYSFDLERATELLIDAQKNPLTEFTYYNGTPVPSGIVDNSFGPDKPRTVELYTGVGATEFERILTVIAENLNSLSREEDLGIRFSVVPVPWGQQYTLASLHQIDGYTGGWIADYNHVMNWLGPMYLSSGTYFSWNLWNVTSLDNLYWEAVEADERGDVAELLRLNDEMNTIANEMVIYLLLWHDIDFFTYSSWLKNWYLNTAIDVPLFPAMYYEAP